jgi:O-antigen/teichoic acid export membrane protein
MKKNLSWLFVANLFKGFYQWALLIIIVKFLSTQEVGLFTLAYAITAPFFMFSNLQLKSIYVVDHRRNSYDFNYFLIRILSVIIVILFIFLYSYINNYNILIIILVTIIKAVESFFDIIHSNFQKQEKMEFMSRSIILQSICSLIVFVITLYLTKSLILSLTSIIVTLLFILFLYDIRILFKINKINLRYLLFIKKHIYHKTNLKFLKQLIFNALPLGLAVFIGSYLTNLPRIYVEKYLGIEQLAFFGAMSYMTIGFFQLLLPIQIVLRPKLAKFLKNRDYKNFNKYLLYAIIVTIFFGLFLEIVFVNFGDYIIYKIYNKDYIDYSYILILLILAQILITITSYFNIAIQAYHIFKLQLIISILILIPSYLVGIFFITTYKMTGAIYLVYFYTILNLLAYLALYKWKKNA